MTRDEITKLLEFISAAYPHAIKNIKDPAAMATAWELALGDFEAGAVYKAARLHIATSKFFPSPADIRDKIIKAELIYNGPTVPTLEAPKITPQESEYLEDFCRFVGLGYDAPDDTALDKYAGFMPWEI